jgi:hypothetical protein
LSVLVFGNYLQTGAEQDSFDLGHAPTLDGILGFFDLEFRAGDRLFFLVSDGALWSASDSAVENPRGFRDQLAVAPMITGTILDGGHWARCRVERRETFRNVYEQKDRPAVSEILAEVNGYDELWCGVREARERMGKAYRYTIRCHLPRISDVRQSLAQGLVATKRRYEITLLLESHPEEQLVRVVVYGDHDIVSSRIYDILDADEYQAALEKRVAEASLEREARFWSSPVD